MPVASATSANADGAEWSKPPIRLRTLVFLAFVGGISLWLYPRAVAAWEVHTLASGLADYAACMAGPTGPGLVRSSGVHDFERLVRRRLVSAAPAEAPFSRCAKLAYTLSGSSDIERAHARKAADFEEYGAKARSPGESFVKLAELHVSAEPVIERAKLAWPFVRDGYTKLVQTSLDAKEAMHPIAPSRPAVGKGLPGARSAYRSVRADRNAWILAQGRGERVGAYRSTDGGVTFKAWPTSVVDSISDRCAIDADGRGFGFGSSQDGSFITVTSIAIGRDPAVTTLMPATSSVVAAACDAGGLVVLARAPKERAPSLYFCEYERSCTKMAGPNLAFMPDLLEYATDVARVSNVTVIAFGMGKVVRVSSSRDRGQTWTPLTVAFDDEEYGNYGAEVRAPTRLLALGKRLVLYGAAQRSGQSYGLLVSEDQGASFRAP
jgi:hypothetical protein